MSLADVLRWICISGALILAVTCCACIVLVSSWDQRARFGVLLGYAVITMRAQLRALGGPLTDTLVLLAVVTVLAVLSTAAYPIKARADEHRRARAEEGSPRSAARPAGDQRRLLGPGAAARGGRHARHSTEPEGGGATP